MSKAILIVGQGPSKSHSGKPLEGNKGTGAKLASMAGVTNERMLELADAVNLLEGFEGKQGKGDKFPMQRAKMAAQAVRTFWGKYARVILLGTKVAEAFDLELTHPCAWHMFDDGSSKLQVAYIPHPSGVNRKYNNVDVAGAVSEFLRKTFTSERADLEVVVSKATRAKQCTEYVESFDRCMAEWAQLAAVLVECERDELYLEVGCSSWREWVMKHAPRSYGFCYMARNSFAKLQEAGWTVEEMKQIKSETAKWATKAKNISPAALRKPEVKAALIGNTVKDAVEAIGKAAPDEHVEHAHNYLMRFQASQYNVVVDAHEACKALKDENISMEDFVEFTISEWMDSAFNVAIALDGGIVESTITVRQAWQRYRGEHGLDQAQEKGSAAVASL
jgi:uracil-DNA glycosylase